MQPSYGESSLNARHALADAAATKPTSVAGATADSDGPTLYHLTQLAVRSSIGNTLLLRFCSFSAGVLSWKGPF